MGKIDLILDLNKVSSKEVNEDVIKDQNLKMYNNLAMEAKIQGKLDDAIKYYKEALKIDSTNFISSYNMGLIFNNKNKYKQSIKLLNIAILSKI